jgi:hypothetical protein
MVLLWVVCGRELNSNNRDTTCPGKREAGSGKREAEAEAEALQGLLASGFGVAFDRGHLQLFKSLNGFSDAS